jgi:hypothetical protein
LSWFEEITVLTFDYSCAYSEKEVNQVLLPGFARILPAVLLN